MLAHNDVVSELGEHFHGPTAMAVHALGTAPLWLMIGGFVLATIIYRLRPGLPAALQQRMPGLHTILEHKYYFDEAYQKLFVQRAVSLGEGLWHKADAGIIDGWLVNGSARLVGAVSDHVRRWQSGYLFQYAFAMILGLIGMLAFWVVL